jgi:hypothetical protein
VEQFQYHASFQAVLNIMMGRPIFVESQYKTEALEIVEFMTHVSRKDEKAFAAVTKRVRECFCREFAHLWTDMNRSAILVFADHIRQFKTRQDYHAKLSSRLDRFHAEGFADLCLQPYADGSQQARCLKAKVIRHPAGITKFRFAA